MAGNPFSGLFSASGEGTGTSRVNNPFDGLFTKAPPPSILTSTAQLKSAAQAKQASQNQGLLKKIGSDVATAGKVVGGVVKSTVQPVINTAKDVNKELIQSATNEASQIVKNPSILIKGSPKSQQIANQNQTYQTNLKSGKISSVVDQTVKSNYDQPTMRAIVNQQVASGANESQIQGALKQKISQQTATTNKIAADVAGTAALGVGGGEAGSAVKGAEALIPKVAKSAVAGAVGNAASTVSANPNATGKQIAEGAAGGAVVGAALPVVGAALGKAARMVFNKAPAVEDVVPKESVKIPVTDQSTGTTTGSVSSVLPKSTGVGASLPVEPRPSDAGFSDTEFRHEFNTPAKQVVKSIPETANAFTATGSRDPLTLTMQTLATTKDPATTGKILDTMVPGMDKGVRKDTITALTKTTDPAEAANLVYDAARNHEAAGIGNPYLVGTPMDKSISFNNPSDLENAQRQQLHVRIGQINKALTAHGTGEAEQSPEYVSDLLKSRQGAQDVLDGKTTYNSAFPKAPAVGAVKPLPFLGDVHEVPATPNGVVDKLPAVQAGDMSRQAVVNRKAVIAATHDTLHTQENTKLFNKLAPEDQKLVEKLETPTQMSDKASDARMVRIAKENAKDPEAFIKYARTLRQDYNTILEHRQALHPETGKLSNFFAHYYDRADTKTNAELTSREEQAARMVKDSNPGYTQHRTIPTLAEADQLGLKRANANVHEDYLQAARQTAAENGRAAFIRGVKEAHGEGSISNYVGRDVVSGQEFNQLKIPGGENLTMPEALAEHYNRRAAVQAPINPGLAGKAANAYRRVNQGAKNTVFAGGAFHGTQSALTIGGQQLLATIRHPSQVADNLRLIGDTFSSKMREAHLASMRQNAEDHLDNMNSIERQRLAGLTYTGTEIQGDIAGKKTGLLNKLPGVKQLHSTVFDRQLPAAKQMIFEQKTANLDLRNPADLMKARKIASGLNKMVGGIDNAVDGLSPRWAKIMDNVALARDYNEGRFETIGNAVSKWGANNPEGRLARQAVVGKSVITALPGMIALVASGKLNPNNLGDVGKAYVHQILDPQIPTSWRGLPTKSAPNGAPISLKLPSTYVAEIAKIIAPAINPDATFSDNRLSGAEDFASSRLAASPAGVEKLAANKDYYGNPIITGGAATSARNIAEQFGPIPIAQGSKVATGQQNATEALLNEAGLKASTSTLPSDTVHAERLNEFYNTKNNIYNKTRAPLIKQINDLISQGNTNQAKRLADQYNASLNQRLTPFRTKYASNYNPEFDKQFLNDLPIRTSGTAFKTRLANDKSSAALLQ